MKYEFWVSIVVAALLALVMAAHGVRLDCASLALGWALGVAAEMVIEKIDSITIE